MSGKRVPGNAGRPARLGPASKRLGNPRTLPAKSQLKASTSTGMLHHASSSPALLSPPSVQVHAQKASLQPGRLLQPARAALSSKRSSPVNQNPTPSAGTAKQIDSQLIQRAKVNLAKRADQFRKARLASAQLKSASLPVQKAPLRQQQQKSATNKPALAKANLSLKDRIASWFVRLADGDDETAAAEPVVDTAAEPVVDTASIEWEHAPKEFTFGGWYSVSKPGAVDGAAVFGSLLAAAVVVVVVSVIVAALVKLGQRGAFGASNTPAFVFAAALLALALFPSGQLSAFVMSCLAIHHLRTPGNNFLGLA